MLVSAIEHHAVLDSARWLAEHEGAQVELLPVDRDGRVQPETLRRRARRRPRARSPLVSVMWANNEVGTVNPVRELAAVAHEHGVPLHTDAVQAVGILPVDFAASGVDALTLTGHKLGGPYGAGALLLGREVPVTPLLHGGGQERDVRSGTLDTPAVVGLATAVELAVAQAPQRAADDRRAARRPRRQDPRHRPGRRAERRPGHRRASTAARRGCRATPTCRFPGCEGDSLLMLLDAHGIECSTGSACTAGVAQPSHVLLAMGADEATARGSLRFSLGHTSTAADVERVTAVIGQVVERARRAGQSR